MEAAWRALAEHARESSGVGLRRLFAEDPKRAERFSAEACGLFLDYAKQRVTEETLRRLLALAEAADLRGRIDAMFAGERINTSEGRPVLHVALRAPRDAGFRVDGRDVMGQVHGVLDRACDFAEAVRTGEWSGFTGRPLRHVVNLGIGGSDLGPRMACAALEPYNESGPDVRFVSNIDPTDLALALRGLDPAETLFVVCSKTFTTLETLANARAAREWCLTGLRDPAAVARHFVAVSSHPEEVERFGIDRARCFGFWDWVGGRFSLWSAVGLSVALAVGPERFRELLAGAHAMDEHFRHAPFERNLPVLMGLLGAWNVDLLGARSHAVLPYDRNLWLLPAHLQQLEMESNGKGVQTDGAPVARDTAPVVFGQPGTDGQHAFYQLLHQGTPHVACDFIGFCSGQTPDGDRHEQLLANLIAQSEALAFGRTPEEVAADGAPAAQVPHRSFPGNRPSSVLLADRLTPGTLGALLALYEHKVLVQGCLWGINSFDQWGVELGKVLARTVARELTAAAEPPMAHDGSTNQLIRRVRARRLP